MHTYTNICIHTDRTIHFLMVSFSSLSLPSRHGGREDQKRRHHCLQPVVWNHGASVCKVMYIWQTTLKCRSVVVYRAARYIKVKSIWLSAIVKSCRLQFNEVKQFRFSSLWIKPFWDACKLTSVFINLPATFRIKYWWRLFENEKNEGGNISTVIS